MHQCLMWMCHSPLQHPQHSCSGETPGLVGQCCPGPRWFGWMWPSGTMWSAQIPPGAWGRFLQRDPEHSHGCSARDHPAAIEVGLSSCSNCFTLCLQNSAPEVDPSPRLPCPAPALCSQLHIFFLLCAGERSPRGTPALRDRLGAADAGALRNIAVCSRPDSTATSWLFSCLVSLSSLSSIQTCFPSHLISSPSSLAFSDLPPQAKAILMGCLLWQVKSPSIPGGPDPLLAHLPRLNPAAAVVWWSWPVQALCPGHAPA